MTAPIGRKYWPKPDLMIAEVIGSPIAHSRSPEIHGQWIRELGLNANFGAAEVDAAELPHWLEQRRIGKMWRGCSVTAPLKQVAAGLVDSLSREAKRLRAVNLIINEGGGLKGYNTDLEGIRFALAPHVRRTGKIVIAGAGGATAAALAYAVDQGFGDINVVARDPARVFNKLGSRFADRFHIVPCGEAHLAVQGADVLINATPMGSSYGAPMRPDILDALVLAAPGAAVFDMNYAPVQTQLLKAAARAGLVPVSGLDMLVGQARRAFKRLFGQEAPAAECIFGNDVGYEGDRLATLRRSTLADADRCQLNYIERH
jgi:shikimate dehydrogenase